MDSNCCSIGNHNFGNFGSVLWIYCTCKNWTNSSNNDEPAPERLTNQGNIREGNLSGGLTVEETFNIEDRSMRRCSNNSNDYRVSNFWRNMPIRLSSIYYRRNSRTDSLLVTNALRDEQDIHLEVKTTLAYLENTICVHKYHCLFLVNKASNWIFLPKLLVLK